ncbi:type VI secretion system baseplate subunit TssE [Vibrio sp. RE86]|uniref:type VI secretion system baseplate subunit TssE n=1 Tax=Vibrio sp. RE86 TaxID=2607605 RepID=UPI00149361E0|nr:type VI secretion system baseplate subunit TssE [Vibrio sp. RE86]NOH79400.1 type VI secretion system baseplate subunit TssE [Vibrio sp. RE86]
MAYFAPEESTFGVGFLERLEANTPDVSMTKGPTPSDVLKSIKLNVTKVLNTRVGGAQSAPSLGLLDFNDATMDKLDLSLKVKLSIQECLQRYEPRLKNILVVAKNDSVNALSLEFYINAEINSAAVHERVQFSLLLDQNRKYRVV